LRARSARGPKSICQTKLVLHVLERLDRRGIEFGPRLGSARIVLEVLEITPHRPRRECIGRFTEPCSGGGEARLGGGVEGDGEHGLSYHKRQGRPNSLACSLCVPYIGSIRTLKERRMSLDHIHLRKLLKILFLGQRELVSALRGDIREELARDAGDVAGGGDFYAPFWYDAKSHTFGNVDLSECVEQRIAANSGRANLYPLLRDGFLLWWNERRRWTNEPFVPGQALKTHFAFPGLNAVVKVEGILSVRDGRGIERFVYPYLEVARFV
jgi:hypothetical protein